MVEPSEKMRGGDGLGFTVHSVASAAREAAPGRPRGTGGLCFCYLHSIRQMLKFVLGFQEASMKLHFAAVGFLAALVACQSLPASPYLMAYDQKYRYINYVEINKVTSDGPGWVVVYSSDANGAPGEVIGYAPVPAGTTWDVRVNVEAGRATKVLFAKLHQDKGTPGVFEFPGPDSPVAVDGSDVMSKFVFDKEDHGHHRDMPPFPVP